MLSEQQREALTRIMEAMEVHYPDAKFRCHDDLVSRHDYEMAITRLQAAGFDEDAIKELTQNYSRYYFVQVSKDLAKFIQDLQDSWASIENFIKQMVRELYEILEIPSEEPQIIAESRKTSAHKNRWESPKWAPRARPGKRR